MVGTERRNWPQYGSLKRWHPDTPHMPFVDPEPGRWRPALFSTGIGRRRVGGRTVPVETARRALRERCPSGEIPFRSLDRHVEQRSNPFSALFWGAVCVIRGLAANSAIFCHYNRQRSRPASSSGRSCHLSDDPSWVKTWLSLDLRLITQNNNGRSIEIDQWVKDDLSLHAFFWIFGT